MDHERARELAITVFKRRVSSSRSKRSWRPDDWRISGPRTEQVPGRSGPRTRLVFAFEPLIRAAWTGVYPVTIAVDESTGKAELLEP